MKAKWIICNLGKDAHIRELFYGVQEAGREVEVLSLKEFVEMLETPSQERACIVTSGSIWVNTYTRQQRPNWTGNWHNEKLYVCSRYYSFWGQHLTQQEYVMLPYAEVLRRKDWLFNTFGFEDEIFIRPDSGAKEFNGELVSKARFDSWDALARKGEHFCRDLLCVVGRPRQIDREFRLIIKNGKVITGSMYRLSKNIIQERLDEIPDMGRIIEFAEKVLTDDPPPLPPVHVLDIAEIAGKFSILEVGCYCCAGLYSCDRRKIAQAVSEAAEEEYEKASNKQVEDPIMT